MARMGGGDEYVDRLGQDVGREQEEGDADDPQRPPLPLGRVDVLELPDDDERGEDLYQRVEPEPGECDGVGGDRGSEHDHGPDNIPSERRVLQP